MAKISVLGAGSWGTALALLLYNNGHRVVLWSALEEEVAMLREKRARLKLPGVKPSGGHGDYHGFGRLPEGKAGCGSPGGAVAVYQKYGALHGSPMCRKDRRSSMRQRCGGAYIDDAQRDYRAGNSPGGCVRAVGPSHAEEVGRGLPTTCVVSARTKETAEYLQGFL